MVTNINPDQRDGILKVVVGLFDAAPGGIYLNDLAGAVQAGMTQQQLADFLSNHPIFINEVLGGRVTPADKVDLLMKNFGLTADNNPTSAGSQAKAYFETKLNAGESIGKVVVDASTYLSGTVAPEFQTTKNLFLNKVAVAAPFSILSNSTDLDVLRNAFSQVTGDRPYNASEAQAIAAAITANTQVLTTGNDIINGKASGDILIGDSTTAQTTDQVDLGSGADTLKMVGVTASVAALPTMKNVETIQIVKGTGPLDFTPYTKALTGVTTIQIDDAIGVGTVTTTDGQTLSLATASGAATTADTTWVGSATDTTSTVTLNSFQSAADAATAKGLLITAGAVTTQTIVSNGTTNNLLTLDLGALTDKLVIKGSGNFNVFDDVTAGGSSTVLKTVDASTATGDVDLTLAAATNAAFAFTGGEGDDNLTLAAGGVTALTAGSQLDGGAGNDTLAVAEAAPLSTADAAKVNATKGFETIAFTVAGSGVDVSAITNTDIKNLQVGAAANGTFTNVNNVSNFVLDNSVTGTAISIANKVGESTTNITVDSGSATAAVATGAITLLGITNVVITSLGNSENQLGANLANKDNSVITIKGDADLSMTIAATVGGTGSKVDGSAATGKLAITGNTQAYTAGSSLGDIIIGGTAADTLKSGANSSTLTGKEGNDTFDVSLALTGSDFKGITSITDFTKGDIIKFAAATAFTTTKVDLSAATTEAAALNLLAAGASTDLKWGVYGGNTYIVDDTGAGATLDATDTAVKLTGTLDLSTSTLATNALTFA